MSERSEVSYVLMSISGLMSFIISTAERVFGFADVARLVDDLPVQVERSTVFEVDHADMPHARRRQIGQDRRAESAGADDDDPRGLELLLALERHLRHDEMAPVAANLFIGEGHVLVDLVDAGNETHGAYHYAAK